MRIPTIAFSPQVFQRYLVWGASTSGVEQTFAHRTRLLLHRQGMAETNDMAVLKCAMERRPSEEAEVIGLAQEIWVEFYCDAKNRATKERIDKGISRRQRGASEGSAKCTETEFLRRRRKATAMEINKKDKEVPEFTLETGAGQKKEIRKQEAKALKRKAECYESGHLLDDEIDEEVKMAHKERKKRRKVNLRDRTNKEQRVVAVTGKRIDLWEDCAEMLVYVSEDCRNDDALDRLIRAATAGVATDRMRAQIFVCSSLSNMGTRLKWAASIVGGWVVDKAFFEQKGKKVPIMKLFPARTVHKEFWFSDGAQRKHSEIFAMTRAAGKKWKILEGGKEHYKTRFEQAQRSHRGPNIIAVLSNRDSKAIATHSEREEYSQREVEREREIESWRWCLDAVALLLVGIV